MVLFWVLAHAISCRETFLKLLHCTSQPCRDVARNLAGKNPPVSSSSVNHFVSFFFLSIPCTFVSFFCIDYFSVVNIGLVIIKVTDS